MEIDNLLVFDVCGKMAHFRKYYTNSSSLSYMFPPRTVVTGIIAAVLGMERDSYYEDFSSEICHIAVSARVPLRKIMQTVNYLQTKDLNGLNGSRGHTQVPLEIILPEGDMIIYRIYFTHRNMDIVEKLKNYLQSGKTFYPIYMGISEFLAVPSYVDCISKDNIIVHSPGMPVQVSTVCNSNIIEDKGLKFSDNTGTVLQYIKEKAPLEFDRDRNIKSTANFICEKNSGKISGVFSVPAYEIRYNGQQENIVFMEGNL
ncbi:type I-B CRISPR-associated protein Cas5b [Calorimonas adulescens]|uniref:Type I-B CRISPR-associated protein Cas5 n=1 Tax=Calorimonas adulescens TaxID=2606906 RepID=A0A5D8QH00_9THEO|nr:type I-B CRISPR-associated protein Cas5b [Calorimonas adulescens]TZE82823.1 type I-B CRISPR-associated protein Cas5 [Calorimonas adulescens]